MNPKPREDGGRASLGDRFQRLVLLNRMSLELFADRPFPVSLGAASSFIMALMGAKFVGIYFCDDFGRPYPAHWHGEQEFTETKARWEETSALTEAFGERRLALQSGAERSWLAMPLLPQRKEGLPEDGVVVVGYGGPLEPSPERADTLLEICRQLRNARLIQRNLQQQKTLAAVTEQSADAVLVTDRESRVIVWNSSAEGLFGHRSEEVIGKPADFLIPAERRAEHQELENRVLLEGSVKSVDTVRVRKGGGLVPVEGTFTLLKDETGLPFGMLRAYRDITQRKEVDRMKSEFVSLVSHELRTPLTSIRGFAETIFDFWDELTGEQRRHYLGIILEESKRLGKLVTDFLDISRLEAGGVSPRPGEVDLPALARRVADLFKEHPSGASFAVDFAPGSEKAWGDEEQLYRVLVNLCGNALKYTPRGGAVRVEGRLSDGNVVIAVADQGPGIAAEDREKLFQKFFRAADPVSLKTPGTGLGLAICKGILDMHRGRIWVESEPGRGARFCFTWPREGLKP